MAGEVDSINPNVEIVNEEPAVIGSGGATFDDLERIQELSDKSKKSESKPAPSKKSEPKPGAKEKGDDDSLEEDEEDGEEVDEDSSEDKKEKTKLTDEQTIKGKKVKATLGGEDIELHTGAMIPVKIDGEVKPVAIQTLINEYSGKQSWDKRFSELDSDRKEFLGRVKGLDSFVQTIFDKAEAIESSDNPVAASFEVMKLIGRLAGKDPRKLLEAMTSAISKDYEKVFTMSDIEKENWGLKRKIELDNLDKEIDSRIEKDQSSKQEGLKKEREFAEKYGLDDDTIESHREYLKKNNLRTDIKSVVELDKVIKVHGVLNEYDKTLLNDKGLVDELVDKSLQDPTFTPEDILTVLKSVYSKGDDEDTSEKNLSRKLGKTSQAKTKKKQSTTPTTKRVNRSDDLWDVV